MGAPSDDARVARRILGHAVDERGHLLFAVAGSGYIAVGIRYEEKDLRRELGEVYQEYSERVPALMPAIRTRGPR